MDEEPHFWIENDQLFYQGDNGPVVVGSPISVRQVLRDLYTGSVFLEVEFYYRGELVCQRIPRENVSRRGIVTLSQFGADFHEGNAALQAQYVRLQEQTASLLNIHSAVGWARQDDRFLFCHHECIGLRSTYVGPLDVEPHGTLDAWGDVIRQNVCGHRWLETALAFGGSGPVVGLIGPRTPVRSLFFHISGDSTTGKTTALQVAVSPFGSPAIQQQGLVTSWLSTSNALAEKLRDNYGVPRAIDEASLGGRDFAGVVHEFTSGQEKARFKSESGQWATTILSSGERPLLRTTNREMGAKIRLIHAADKQWTDSAAHAEAIREGLLSNNGTAGPELARFLIELGPEEVYSLWNDWRSSLLRDLPSTRFAERISAQMAFVMVAADCLRKAVDIDLDVQGIRSCLLEIERDGADDRSIADEAYEAFVDAVARNKHRLAEQPGRESWGRIVSLDDGSTEVQIMPEPFERLMKDQGFDNPLLILKQWRTDGRLDAEADKTTRKKNLFGVKGVRCHCVKLPTSSNMETDDRGDIDIG